MTEEKLLEKMRALAKIENKMMLEVCGRMDYGKVGDRSKQCGARGGYNSHKFGGKRGKNGPRRKTA